MYFLKAFAATLLFASKATPASISPTNAVIAATSWGSPRVDVFGTAPDKTIWHKFETGFGWEPSSGFENMNGTSISYPTVVSWGKNRLDYFYVGEKGGAYHKYWDGSQWNPSASSSEDLEGDFTSPLAVSSWSTDRLDIVGRSSKGQYIHKAWTGTAWFPSFTEWEDFGGNFSSAPTVVSWGPNRLDIFGIDADTGGIKHKYWNGDSWSPSNSDWEDLGGGPFTGTPVASSWGKDRFDVWAAGVDGKLYHLFWDGSSLHGWEALGGSFKTAPAVVHWDVGKIDIVGLFDASDDTHYHSKSYDGSQWYPGFTEWYDKSGDFAAQPTVVVNKGSNFLYILGVANNGKVELQIYDGYSWQPSTDRYWGLGDVRNPYPDHSKTFVQQMEL